MFLVDMYVGKNYILRNKYVNFWVSVHLSFSFIFLFLFLYGLTVAFTHLYVYIFICCVYDVK